MLLSQYTNLFFPICSLAVSFLLPIIYFSKKNIKNDETNIYGKLIMVGFVEALLYFFICFIAHMWLNDSTLFMFEILNKILYSVYIIWFTFLFYYMVVVSLGITKRNKKIKSVKMILYVIDIILIFLIFITNVKIYYDAGTGLSNSYGPSADILSFGIGMYLFALIVVFIMNFKSRKEKKYFPLYVVIILMIVAFIIRQIDPFLSISSNVLSFTLLVMYFTIENPDLKMLEELYKNRKIIERSNEAYSNFVFKMTQDVKRPVKDIIKLSSDSTDKNLKEINNIGKNLDYLIEDALDISQMTTRKIKLYNTRYNPKNLISEIKKRAKHELKDNVKFEYHISPNMPEYVYGDTIKIKQIISSVIDNSIQRTKKGHITLEINTIIKYGICRFIIDINDNGETISIDKVNEILSFKETDELFNLDKSILSLKEAKLLTNKIGGSFMIKSNEEFGTTVSITIEQKIVETKETEISKKLELYEESLQKNKRVIVVDDDLKELTLITNQLESEGVNVSGPLFGRDVLEKISNFRKFDLIILDDETNTYSAYEILKELQKNEKFNTPVVIMIDDTKEFIKLHYLKDGFADVIMKSKLQNELDRILKRF